MMEPEDVARFRREIAAMGNKADDAEGFAQLVDLLNTMRTETERAARRLNVAERMSWAELAKPLGVSRQALRERFGVST